MRVLWFGTYSVGGGYPRNTVLIESLRAVGVEVRECHVPLFGGAQDKVAAARSLGALMKTGLRAVGAWVRLAFRFYRAGRRDIVVVGYTGHADVYLARLLSIVWRKPVVLDAFLSPYDTVVFDRGIVASNTRAARTLFHLERGALRLSDLVLTDTTAHSDHMASLFSVPRSRFVSIPVGSLVKRPARRLAEARVPVAVGVAGGGVDDESSRPFRAFFCGSFVPLQGVDYILDAAARAPDIEFALVGDGPDGARVERDVAARNLPNVRFERTFIARDELERRLAEADAVLGVFGKTAKSPRVVPCKVYDGLAAGLPVVTGGGAGPAEWLHDGQDSLLVSRDDPAELVRALRRLRDEPGLAPRLRAGARRAARERFSRRAIGQRLLEALQRVV